MPGDSEDLRQKIVQLEGDNERRDQLCRAGEQNA